MSTIMVFPFFKPRNAEQNATFNCVPKELVELHLKLMRKIGKSVTADRWEKYLIKICQEFNSTWAWEMEKKGYLEMSVECKLALLKYLCECQFDDNLKFKNIINEEDADTMRLQPIGRDKDGLMYWYQLDQDHNVRMYIEEQDDQDGSSWKCIVRNRNELAETLALLKAQIDPVLLKNSSQQDSSSRDSPSLDDEETKKEEETPKQVSGLEAHIVGGSHDTTGRNELGSAFRASWITSPLASHPMGQKSLARRPRRKGDRSARRCLGPLAQVVAEHLELCV
ncbi:Remodeling and spacing factor 1 [Myotis brandtii]|uniref:Remodeling and spacing factor 1 n=1 Tax=Myotis brandtii TaxID=109478 RepID=S7MV17_MYOBR|nr:Remodeling and spacing factor 1 [Myotis brandtii]